MSLFSSIDIGRTGVGFSQYWLDTVSHNIANINTINEPGEEPFRARLVVAQELGSQITSSGSGVGVADVVEYEIEPPEVFDPFHPLADENGIVTMPAVDLGAHMVDLMLAQRNYQVNISTIQSAEQAYRSALTIGQR